MRHVKTVALLVRHVKTGGVHAARRPPPYRHAAVGERPAELLDGVADMAQDSIAAHPARASLHGVDVQHDVTPRRPGQVCHEVRLVGVRRVDADRVAEGVGPIAIKGLRGDGFGRHSWTGLRSVHNGLELRCVDVLEVLLVMDGIRIGGLPSTRAFAGDETNLSIAEPHLADLVCDNHRSKISALAHKTRQASHHSRYAS
mmetsp:Transcript_96658/g.242471  ORF Transcript_96658/g.242471 Transcript_96658/m.242471 type:complete len:200 (+) Transcript_96658:218-817(+)|eukprot:CAMPEP_0115266556 /NCGR_PEP_ID=MMETSP0270-20121206/51527_1 /TAXON_ID=71861 /ORGANISM="Scrippsiella trochoidea, Strain CCMP3099" /LENGTH=199 /DNA_ID=CAMNT_0002682653 /DNA_START=179 /DNA_END=778 /DNA_ORIENTATION=+